MERDVPQRLLECFEAIDKKGGRAVLMDFYRVTGNQKNEEKIVRFMLLCNLIVKREDGKDTFFEKTEDGKALHQLIKNRDYLGPLFESLGQTRLRFDDFKGLE